jgi:hypothetical protein
MRTSLDQLVTTLEGGFGALYSAGFLLLWLFCWPLYRFVRSHTIRG